MSNITLREAQELLLIDKHQLDIEVEYQPSLANRIGEEMVHCESRRDEAKEAVGVTDAEIANSIRKEATDKGDKVTEAKVASMVLQDPFHKKAMSFYLNLKKEAAIWAVTRADFVARAFMISQMCGLHDTEYFARESVTNSNKVEKVRGLLRERMIEEKDEQRRERVPRR
jgi:hypothetical protein